MYPWYRFLCVKIDISRPRETQEISSLLLRDSCLFSDSWHSLEVPGGSSDRQARRVRRLDIAWSVDLQERTSYLCFVLKASSSSFSAFQPVSSQYRPAFPRPRCFRDSRLDLPTGLDVWERDHSRGVFTSPAAACTACPSLGGRTYDGKTRGAAH